MGPSQQKVGRRDHRLSLVHSFEEYISTQSIRCYWYSFRHFICRPGASWDAARWDDVRRLPVTFCETSKLVQQRMFAREENRNAHESLKAMKARIICWHVSRFSWKRDATSLHTLGQCLKLWNIGHMGEYSIPDAWLKHRVVRNVPKMPASCCIDRNAIDIRRHNTSASEFIQINIASKLESIIERKQLKGAKRHSKTILLHGCSISCIYRALSLAITLALIYIALLTKKMCH